MRWPSQSGRVSWQNSITMALYRESKNGATKQNNSVQCDWSRKSWFWTEASENLTNNLAFPWGPQAINKWLLSNEPKLSSFFHFCWVERERERESVKVTRGEEPLDLGDMPSTFFPKTTANQNHRQSSLGLALFFSFFFFYKLPVCS